MAGALDFLLALPLTLGGPCTPALGPLWGAGELCVWRPPQMLQWGMLWGPSLSGFQGSQVVTCKWAEQPGPGGPSGSCGVRPGGSCLWGAYLCWGAGSRARWLRGRPSSTSCEPDWNPWSSGSCGLGSTCDTASWVPQFSAKAGVSPACGSGKMLVRAMHSAHPCPLGCVVQSVTSLVLRPWAPG